MLELIVEDNGQSPPAANHEHLFDPFFSGRSAGRGRGMGLPTAWRWHGSKGAMSVTKVPRKALPDLCWR